MAALSPRSPAPASGRRVPVRPPRGRLERLVRRLTSPRVGWEDVDRRQGEVWARTALATIDRAGLHVLTPDMDAYPAAFHQLAVPPDVVFAAGRLDLLATPMVAIVGTRRCSARGEAIALRIAGGLVAAGVTVVSGLALGIDGAAHRGAGADRTVAVLGCGVDVPYPPRHRPLQREIGRQGLLLSEQPPGARPLQYHFPRRNRMIAALARAVVVVEAPEKSGALITADHALDLGRNVFVVPGPADAPAAQGSNRLIGDGGALVTGAHEILLTLGIRAASDDGADPQPAGLHGVGLALWRSLGPEPRHVDELATELGLGTGHALASLFALEVRGHARQRPGMRFARP